MGMSPNRLKIILAIITVCLMLAQHHGVDAERSSSITQTEYTPPKDLRGGHFRIKQHNEGEILIDYTLDFKLGGEHSKKCTEQDIQSKTIIETNIPIFHWENDPIENEYSGAIEIGKVQFVCILRDDVGMKRIVGKMDNLKYKTNAKKIYIGIKYKPGTTIQPLYSYYNTERRSDTGRRNTMPIVTMFPYYKVDLSGEHKLQLHQLDEDNDYLKCTLADTNKVLENCEFTILKTVPPGEYFIRLKIEDMQNKGQVTNKEGVFSFIIVSIDVGKVNNTHPKTLKPRFESFLEHSRCDYQLADVDPDSGRVKTSWSESLSVKYNSNTTLNRIQVIGPKGVTYKTSDQKNNKMRVDLSWNPSQNNMQNGKYIICVHVSATDKSGVQPNIHISDTKCYYLHVGTDYRYMKMSFIKPNRRLLNAENFDRFEIKVLGAFQKPTAGESTFILKEKSTDNEIYTFPLADGSTTYNITSDNRLIIQSPSMRNLTIGKSYYVEIYGDLFVSQAECANIETKSPGGDWKTIGWDFEVGYYRDLPASAADFQQSPQNKSNLLQCYHDHMRFTMPNFKNQNIQIKKVTLNDDSCRLIYNKSGGNFFISTQYGQCKTTMKEEREFILFKNIVRVHFVKVEKENSLIERSRIYFVGLECRMRKRNINTIKGKRKEADGILVGPQTLEINEYARNNASFEINFQVYKSDAYDHPYGTEEFPIHLPISKRLYFELALSRSDEMKIIPQSCWATSDRSYLSQARYYIIEERCPKDLTYQKHNQKGDNEENDQKFRFSIETFHFKEKKQESIFVHCESYVCRNRNDCKFRCPNSVLSRNRRDVNGGTVTGMGNTETFMTSTLEINIEELPSAEDTTITGHKSGSQTMLMYMQIPIALCIIGIIFGLWKYRQGRSTRKEVVEENLILEREM
eukprot:TCONS_00049290-protein